MKGLVHVTNSDLSMLQPKWSMPTPPVSLPENANVIEVDFVLAPLVMALLLPSVAESILVYSATVSTVQLREAGDGSLFPTLSSDNTLKVWTPSFNDCGSLYGLVHVTNSDLSMLQPKWSIPTPPVSLPENANVIEVDLVLPPLAIEFLLPSVAESILVVGAVVSTLQLNEAGDGSLFPILSWALIFTVWDPSGRLLNCIGLVQILNDAPSSEHSKWSNPIPVSFPENVKVIAVDVVLPPGAIVLLLPSFAEVILLEGAVVSTLQVNISGELSRLPELSTALTLNV